MSEVSRYTSAIPPLHTVKDADVRRVLEALVSGWRTRNGDTQPNSEERFITKGELQSLVESVNAGYFVAGAPGEQLIKDLTKGNGQNILSLLQRVTDSVLTSRLFTELGERVRLIDLRLIDEQTQRVRSVQQVADDLAAEAATRLGFDNVTGSRVDTLEETTDDQALLISGLTTRVSGAESTIVTLEQTTATQATSLTALTTRVGNAESNITSLDETTANQATALDSLTTRVGDAESSITTLNTTTANQAQSLTLLESDVNSNRAAISQEATTRANADNAITETVNTQLSTVNNNVAALQTTTTTLTNNVSSLSNSLTTLQATVGDNTAAISTEADARVTADGRIESKYTVKVDTNGYVSGFGLIGTDNDATPTSEFVVRADKFAIASPAGPSITPKVPFVVQTTSSIGPDGGVIPPGVYMDSAVVKELRGTYLYGTYIQAGTFEAAVIKSGSSLYDAGSGYELRSVAASSIGPVDTSGAGYFWWSGLRFYGSRFHYAAPVNQRIRSPGSQSAVTFVVTANATVDHFFSVWYKTVNILNIAGAAQNPSLPPDQYGWIPLAISVEPQKGYGTAALSASISISVTANQLVDFAISPLNLDGTTIFATDLRTAFATVQVINL